MIRNPMSSFKATICGYCSFIRQTDRFEDFHGNVCFILPYIVYFCQSVH